MGKVYKKQVELKAELDQALTQIEIGAKYRHYKGVDKVYTVLNLAFAEEDNTLCVVYQAEYEQRLVFTRPFSSWNMMVEWQGQTVPRFTKISGELA
jgi:hypothetical protein